MGNSKRKKAGSNIAPFIATDETGAMRVSLKGLNFLISKPFWFHECPDALRGTKEAIEMSFCELDNVDLLAVLDSSDLFILVQVCLDTDWVATALLPYEDGEDGVTLCQFALFYSKAPGKVVSESNQQMLMESISRMANSQLAAYAEKTKDSHRPIRCTRNEEDEDGSCVAIAIN